MAKDERKEKRREEREGRCWANKQTQATKIESESQTILVKGTK